jgi:hypothetical protein
MCGERLGFGWALVVPRGFPLVVPRGFPLVIIPLKSGLQSMRLASRRAGTTKLGGPPHPGPLPVGAREEGGASLGEVARYPGTHRRDAGMTGCGGNWPGCADVVVMVMAGRMLTN